MRTRASSPRLVSCVAVASIVSGQRRAACAQTARRWPETMLATATHDTKRGEDARVRIDLLSQAPEAWRQRLRTWSQLNAGLERATGLDRNTQHLLYQSLVGAWPV